MRASEQESKWALPWFSKEKKGVQLSKCSWTSFQRGTGKKKRNVLRRNEGGREGKEREEGGDEKEAEGEEEEEEQKQQD